MMLKSSQSVKERSSWRNRIRKSSRRSVGKKEAVQRAKSTMLFVSGKR